MKNTIITSVSALVFLFIGLLIGKSNKQIEIQTVVKTNIVEKPVEKVVEKIVEKIVEKTISDEDLKRISIGSLVENAKIFKTNEIPKGIDSISVNLFYGSTLYNLASQDNLKNKIESDLRKAGINVNDNGKYVLTVKIGAIPTEFNILVLLNFSLNSTGYYFENEECYKGVSALWKKDLFEIVEKNNAESGFNSFIKNATTQVCNLISKSKE